MSQEMFGEADPTLDAAAMKIMGIGIDNIVPDLPKRENRDVRDPTERETSTDLEEAEQEARASKASEADDKSETKAGADEGADDFLEIPGAEGEEAERVPLAEAIDAIKQVRELTAGKAEILNQVETEARGQAEKVINDLVAVHTETADAAEAFLRSLPIPQAPSQRMLDRNSQEYDPETYHLLKIQHENQVQAIQSAYKGMLEARDKAEQAKALAWQQTQEAAHSKLARHWPDWKDASKRESMQKSFQEGLSKHYGISAEDFAKLDEKIGDYRLMLLVKDALDGKAKAASVAPPEIKKAVQERAAKVVKGRAMPARDESGKFQSQALDRLKQTGSEKDFAAYLLNNRDLLR